MRKLVYVTIAMTATFLWLSLNASAAEFGVGIDFPHVIPSYYLNGAKIGKSSDTEVLQQLRMKLQEAQQRTKDLRDPRIKSQMIQDDISKVIENLRELETELQNLK